MLKLGLTRKRSRHVFVAMFSGLLAGLVLVAAMPAQADQRLEALMSAVREAERKNNLRGAMRRAESALRHAERTYGPEHPETARVMVVLAKLYRRAGRVGDAVAMEQRLAQLSPTVDQSAKSARKKTAGRPKWSTGGQVEEPRALRKVEPANPSPPTSVGSVPPPSAPVASLPRAARSPLTSVPPPSQPVVSEPVRERAAPHVDGALPMAVGTQLLDPAKFAEVPVYFGTNRAGGPARVRDGVSLATFTSVPSIELSIGEARVSVPRQGRTVGEIPRPRGATFWRAAEKEDPDIHFTMVSISTLTREVFQQRVNLRLAASSGAFRNHAFVFVHGFNVSFDDAVYRTAQIAYDLDFTGAPFVFSWPTLEGTFGYVGAKDRALASRAALRDFLDLVSQNTGAERIHLIAHSMGTWPLLDVLREIAVADANRASPRFSEVVLVAPDMDRDNFSALAARICPARDEANTRCAGGPAAGMTFFATSNDRALLASVKLAAGIDRAGLFDERRPFIVKNIDTIDVSAADTSVFAYNHSQPLERKQLLQDIGRLLAASARPPHTRTPSYEMRQTAAGDFYWKYQQQP